MALGEKIGEGAFAEVHQWREGTVVKLFRAGVPRQLARYEAYLTRAAHAAGAPAPEVLEEVEVDGRQGMVMRRLVGATLSNLVRTGQVSPEEAGDTLAGLARAVQGTAAPPNTLPLRRYMEGALRGREERLPKHIATGVLAMIDALPVDERLAHCDLHSANVIMTVAGPKLLDWTGARRGGAAYELACSKFLHAELIPGIIGQPERQRRLYAAMQREYARLAGVPQSSLSVLVRAHLPVVRTFFLLGALSVRASTRKRLLHRLERDVASRP